MTKTRRYNARLARLWALHKAARHPGQARRRWRAWYHLACQGRPA